MSILCFGRKDNYLRANWVYEGCPGDPRHLDGLVSSGSRESEREMSSSVIRTID